MPHHHTAVSGAINPLVSRVHSRRNRGTIGLGWNVKTTFDFTTGTLDSRITFTRASTATYVNSSGLVASAAINAARFDYDPSTLLPLGLPIEEQRTNLCLYSDDLTNAAWTATNVTTAKTATGPDGVSNSATTVTASAANGTILQAITSTSAARITSCWIKRRTGSGTINMTQDNGTTWSPVTVTASWTRVNISSATAANPIVGLQIVTSGDAVDVALFQHELGAIITSAIPTTSATVTRSADKATMTGANLAWMNQSQGTFLIDAVMPEISGIRGLCGFSGGGHVAFVNADGSTSFFDGVQTSTAAGSWTAGRHKIATAFSGSTADQVVGGGTPASGSWSTPWGDGVAFGIGSLQAAAQYWLNGHIVSLAFYNTRLPTARLQALTA